VCPEITPKCCYLLLLLLLLLQGKDVDYRALLAKVK
jgi:hypothetical protein